MSLLELEHVSKRYGSGPRESVVLRDVSLELDAGEHVAVYGQRRSGRSTFLRVAAGVEPADKGVVRFDGHDLDAYRGKGLGRTIGYCRKAFRPAEGRTVLEELMVGLLGRGLALNVADAQARSALERTGAEQCAALKPNGLDSAEGVRVGIAEALSHKPNLLVIDDPTLGVDLLARDGILLLLRSLADEGIAVLTSTGDTAGLSAAHRALSLGEGKLNGSLSPHLASVHPLRALAGLSASA
jgi:ABC-type multidrug transport system ATPase subunit